MIEVQNDAIHDRNSERKKQCQQQVRRADQQRVKRTEKSGPTAA